MSPASRIGRIQLAAVIRKEVHQTVRDRRVMALLILAPLLQSIVFGYAIEFQVDRVPTVVVDADHSATSRAHARRLLADGTLRKIAQAGTPGDAMEALRRDRAAVALILPSDLERDTLAGRPASVQVLLDGTDPNRATVAAGAVTRYFGETAAARAREQAGAHGLALPPVIQATPRILFNAELRTPPFMIPGVMAILLLITTTIVSAMGLSREREMGTFEQVMVTPIRPLHLLVGKMVPFAVIGIVNVLLVLSAGVWLFHVPARGSLALVFVASLLYLLCTLGVGLLISTISRTQQQSFLAGFLFVMPAILLSGVMTPIRGMPEWLRVVTYVNPVRYYVECLRANLLKGAGFADMWVELVILAVLGLGILGAATARFQKRVA